MKTTFKCLNRDQRGITLIEMLVVVALFGILAAGILATISQVLTVNARTSSNMVALRQVQQAGDSVSRDVLQARPSEIDHQPSGGQFLVAGSGTFDDATNQWHRIEVEYHWIEQAGDGLASLERRRSEYNTDGVLVQFDKNTVARYLVEGETSVDWDPVKRQLIFKVKARVGEQTQEREYEIRPRPDV